MDFTKQHTFADFKKTILNFEPMPTKVSLSDLGIDTNGNLTIAGKQFYTGERVANSLLRAMQIPPSFAKKFGNWTSEETKAALIDTVKKALAKEAQKKDGAATVTLLGNPATKTIIKVLSPKKDYISNSYAIKILEDILNKYSQLSCVSYDIKNDGGFEITLRAQTATCPKDSKGNYIKNEDYIPGITIINNPNTGIYVLTYMFRIICTNGATSYLRDENSLNIQSLRPEITDSFYKDMDVLAQNNFIAGRNNASIERAINTKASFAEAQTGLSILLKNSTLTGADAGIYMPEFSEAERKLFAKGLDYTKFTAEQLANYPINASVWDIVNRVTEFGSHDFNYDAKSNVIQREAGKIFSKKTYDTENLALFQAATNLN